jgi:hypothetical protein
MRATARKHELMRDQAGALRTPALVRDVFYGRAAARHSWLPACVRCWPCVRDGANYPQAAAGTCILFRQRNISAII